MNTPAKKNIFTVTEPAAAKIKTLLDSRGKPSAGIRVGVKQRGCSGHSYKIEFVDEPHELDEVVETADIKIFIDPKAILFVIGTEMDFVESKIESGFIFKNPNEKGRCGCGESFHV